MGLLYDIAALGNEERQCLLEREAVARLVQFYQTGRGDRLNVRASVPGLGAGRGQSARLHPRIARCSPRLTCEHAFVRVCCASPRSRWSRASRVPQKPLTCWCALVAPVRRCGSHPTTSAAVRSRCRSAAATRSLTTRSWYGAVAAAACSCVRRSPSTAAAVHVTPPLPAAFVFAGCARGERPRHRCTHVLPPVLRRHRHRRQHGAHAAGQAHQRHTRARHAVGAVLLQGGSGGGRVGGLCVVR